VRGEREAELGVDGIDAGDAAEIVDHLGRDARGPAAAEEQAEQPWILGLRRLELDLIDREDVAEQDGAHAEAQREEEDQRRGADRDAEAAREERAAGAPEVAADQRGERVELHEASAPEAIRPSRRWTTRVATPASRSSWVTAMMVSRSSR